MTDTLFVLFSVLFAGALLHRGPGATRNKCSLFQVYITWSTSSCAYFQRIIDRPFQPYPTTFWDSEKASTSPCMRFEMQYQTKMANFISVYQHMASRVSAQKFPNYKTTVKTLSRPDSSTFKKTLSILRRHLCYNVINLRHRTSVIDTLPYVQQTCLTHRNWFFLSLWMELLFSWFILFITRA